MYGATKTSSWTPVGNLLRDVADSSDAGCVILFAGWRNRLRAAARINILADAGSKVSDMARTKLRKLNGQRQRFTARIERRGVKPGWQSAPSAVTILLVDLRDFTSGALLTDHLWVAEGRWGKTLPDGADIAFDARVSQYKKGLHHDTIDWRLARPTRVAIWNGDADDWKPAPRPRPQLRTAASPPPSRPAVVNDEITARQREFIARILKHANPPETMPADVTSRAQAVQYIDALLKRIPPPTCAGIAKGGRPCRNPVAYGPPSYCIHHRQQNRTDSPPE